MKIDFDNVAIDTNHTISDCYTNQYTNHYTATTFAAKVLEKLGEHCTSPDLPPVVLMCLSEFMYSDYNIEFKLYICTCM